MYYTRDDEIAQIDDTFAGHVVLLGAGASLAALPNGDLYGKKLPLMQDLVDTLGMSEIFREECSDFPLTDFEGLYSVAAKDGRKSLLAKCRKTVWKYFSSLQLPEEPTLYDLLVLSLRGRDTIATFNWDPFILQAVRRTESIRQGLPYPKLLFLHGNVSKGYCLEDKVIGFVDDRCLMCGRQLKKSKLLFPIKNKNYSNHPVIKDDWSQFERALISSLRLTIFGYSAPKSDAKALAVIRKALHERKLKHEFRQVEIIDIKSKEELGSNWRDTIYSHHWESMLDIRSSSLFQHPRRSMEAFNATYLDAKFCEGNPIPTELNSWDNVKDFFLPILAIERERARVA